MTLNPLKEKGIPLDKQMRVWQDIVRRPFKRDEADCYTRTRQILMNGIEIEAWTFKHQFLRTTDCMETKKLLADTRRIEDTQQTTVNWLTPANQSVLDTTLGYEQVAVDLTAWLSQNEPDDYVKETYDYGLLEDFDHLYRYAQFAYLIEGSDPNEILHYQTDVTFARPTQYHHNANRVRLRKAYERENASPQTKANILTLLAGEQQTHNYYAEHGFMYGSCDLRELYAEICDVEEEHVTMYETLIDPNETMYEKLLLREFMEVCCYHNCYKDEVDPKIKLIWEELLAMEIEHLQIAAKLLEKKEGRDAEEIIGNKTFDTCHFESQKEYVTGVIKNEVDKRLDGTEDMSYCKIADLPEDWASYEILDVLNKADSPSENSVRLSMTATGSDVSSADSSLLSKRGELIKRALDSNSMAPNTVSTEEYRSMPKESILEEVE